MARSKTPEIDETILPSGRQIVIGVDRPKRQGGAGRPRIATEFDDLVLDWYNFYLNTEDKDKAWVRIPCTDEDDRKQVGNQLRKAVDYQNEYRSDGDELGVTRHPDTAEDGSLVLVVQIHERLERGPKGPRNASDNGEIVEAE